MFFQGDGFEKVIILLRPSSKVVETKMVLMMMVNLDEVVPKFG